MALKHAMVSYFQLLLEAITRLRCRTSLSPFLLVALLLLSPLFLRMLVFFAPLLLSTAVFTAVIFIFLLSDKLPAGELFFGEGEKVAFRLFQLYDEVNCSRYKNRIQAACFLVKSSRHIGVLRDDSEGMMLAGRLEVGSSNAISDDDVSSVEVDGLAEDIWNYYLGRFSRWHAFTSLSDNLHDSC